MEPVPAALVERSRDLYALLTRGSELAEKVLDDTRVVHGLDLPLHRLRFVAAGVIIDVTVAHLETIRMVVRTDPVRPTEVAVVTPSGVTPAVCHHGLVVVDVASGPTSVRLAWQGARHARHLRTVHTDWFIP